jgi:CheY-like chemotaxis protein
MTVSILLVDDDDVAREAMIRNLRKSGADIDIVEAEDGFAALQIMLGVHPVRVISKPYFVFLDLNMPRMDGFELLNLVRGNPKIADTTIYVLSTSNARADQKMAYDKNVAGYLVKSQVGKDFGMLANLMKVPHATSG